MKQFIILGLLTLILSGCGEAATTETKKESSASSVSSSPSEAEEPNDVTIITDTEVDVSVTPKAPEPVPVPAKKEPAVQAAQEFNVTSGYLFFKPSTIKAKVNKPVKITFTNTGMHDFTINELGVKVDLKGTRGVASFTPTKTGTYTYYCSVAGHKEGGMVGTLVVE